MDLLHMHTYLRGIEFDPSRLRWVFLPMWWVGVSVILGVSLGTMCQCRGRSWKLLYDVAVCIGVFYLGLSLVLIAATTSHAFTTIYGDDLAMQPMLRVLRTRQIGFVCEIAGLWGIGAIVIGLARVIRFALSKQPPSRVAACTVAPDDSR